MAPQYKFTYFGLKGISEGIRFLLAYMDADWEDNRVAMEQWAALKPTWPWGKLPILEVDGKVLTSSLSILRLLGRKAGLAGKDDWEDAQIDIIAETLDDFRWPATTFMWEKDAETKQKKKDVWQKETLPFYMKKFDSIVKQNGGYLANGKLSWVDLHFVGMLEYLSYNADVEDLTVDYPNLHAHRLKIVSLPRIAEYIAKRPKTPF